jgi:peptide/nickel transport system substrate-binding protein
MFRKFVKKPLALMIVAVMVFAACGTSPAPDPTPPVTPPPADAPPPAEVIEDAGGLAELVEDLQLEQEHHLARMLAAQERFPAISGLQNPNAPIQGGLLRVAIPSATPMSGIFSPVFWNAGIDNDFMQWFEGGSVFSSTPAMTFGQYGIVTYTFDVDAQTMTLTQVEDVYWHDGVPLTLDDLVFAIEVIAHPDYLGQGIRFGEAIRNIVGVDEFHAQTADTISGMVLANNNRELTVHFHDFPPGLLHFGWWSTPKPRHVWEGIPVAGMSEHYRTRVSPIGWGPFIVQNIVPGESVHLIANDNFWLGRPYVDEVILQIVNPDLLPTFMLEGQFDIAMTFPDQHFADYQHATNIQFLGDVSNITTYFGFNLGTFFPHGYVRTEAPRNPWLENVNLRRAMGYAFNEGLIAESFFHGLRFPATTIVPAGHSAFMDADLTGFVYNPALARQLLDEAGFIDIDGDGFRESPDGEQFTLNLLVRVGQGWDIRSQFYIQSWADIGIRVELWQGRQHDFFAMIDSFFDDDAEDWQEVDIFEFAWGAGFDPNPRTLWGDSSSNRVRFVTDEMRDVFDRIGSPQAWDTNWLVQQYHEWQRMAYDYAFVIPTCWRMELAAVNNRVLGYELVTVLHPDGNRTRGGFHRIQLTANEPYRQ